MRKFYRHHHHHHVSKLSHNYITYLYISELYHYHAMLDEHMYNMKNEKTKKKHMFEKIKHTRDVLMKRTDDNIMST